MNTAELLSAILSADQRIRGQVVETPLQRLHGFADHPDTKVLAKLENLQITGSFKLRGVTNKLAVLDPQQKIARFVAASTGNHGVALSYATERLGKNCLVFVPESASATKIRRIEASGGTIKRAGTDCSETESLAREYARSHRLPYISPYNDQEVIAGQGSIGCELRRQSEQLDAVFVPVGGGGLISGIATYLKSTSPHTQIIGCSPTNSKVMMESIMAGQILELDSRASYSDGTAGGIEANSITFELCQTLVDRFIEVSETEIAASVRRIIDCDRQLVEGAAGVALAAFLQTQSEWEGCTVGIVVSGGNVDSETLKRMLNHELD